VSTGIAPSDGVRTVRR